MSLILVSQQSNGCLRKINETLPKALFLQVLFWQVLTYYRSSIDILNR